MRPAMNLSEKTLVEHEKFSGKIIRVHLDDVELPNGAIAEREVVDHPGGVCVAVLNDKSEIYLVRQFRYPYKELLLELPAGKLEIGEDPFEAAKREQREETGTVGENYVSLGELYPSPGYCGEIIRMWACRATEEGEKNLDEDEFLETVKMPLEKAAEMVINNEIKDSKTQVGILKTLHLVKEGKL